VLEGIPHILVTNRLSNGKVRSPGAKIQKTIEFAFFSISRGHIGFYMDKKKIQDIIVMDANHKGRQFSSRLLQRDLNKAWACFEACPSAQISTGNFFLYNFTYF
jgi:hypothetical protein